MINIFNSSISFNVEQGLIFVFVAFLVAMIISYLSHPIVIKVSNLKGLLPQINNRSIHVNKTPSLGGIGIFLALNLTITFLGNYLGNYKLLIFLGSLTIMFFVGLVDDLITISAKSKIVFQVIAASYFILITNVKIEGLQGLFGIYEFPYFISVIVTIIFFVVLINAYNLIDGVDGLAGCFAIVISLFFGSLFYLTRNYFMFVLSVILIGAIIPFLIYNFSKKNKIFMGDTGSMTIGFVLAYQAINFISTDISEITMFANSKSLICFLALFSFPLIDTMRIFYIRLKAGVSPFKADKNHLHHVLLSKGFKHAEISLIVCAYTILMVLSTFVFKELAIIKQVVILGIIWLLTVTVIDNLKLDVLFKNLKSKSKVIDLPDTANNKKDTIFNLNELVS
ncbi:glycosyltransferase family 4 protein [uncultured Polaribacter sp.]|uniref:glycosyltransferase family 4 protein n=1 Tax=uncultured Polaribacter sp. TaxID=174711 RepID=UPI002610576D|nr:MraY family glycosyltransferase [uncultured Polaribacter sp.]